ncbi:hypothetical protein Q7Z90_07610 [Glaesserella parasuis]|uniref:hypothetical protein n=1 Tax=Glaesserella parasuis TaxID=738 RepID=UPI00047B4B81|nr:hypothetical protein [Glaesserella parasuis]MDP0328674.1 hypothetical protein [Glaesserella parasuis]MDP0391153.1 hypothetical protein [Glaesserella parasuis]
MSKQAAFKLIIENIQMFDEASHLINDDFDSELFNAVDNVIKEFEFDFECKGKFDFVKERESRFYPSHWLANSSDGTDANDCYAHYYFGFESEETGKAIHYWGITSLFSNAERMVLGFYSWKKQFSKCGNKDWKEFMIEQNKKYTKLEKLGFKFNTKEHDFYLPIKPLDPKKVIENYPDSLEDAMEPIRDALKTLKEAHPIFNEIVEAAKKKFSTS